MIKNILVTGASTGIGFDITTALLKENCQVWAGVRNPDSLIDLKKKFPSSLHILKLDVSSAEDIDRAWNEISQSQAYIVDGTFALINNAGIAVGGPIEAIPLENWKKLFDVNVFGLVAMTKKFLPLLRKTKGRVINIGSISGRISSPFLGPYTASKHAVKAISDSLRREMIPLGVQVVLIEPGPIKTPIWSKSVESSLEIKKNLSPEMLAVYSEAIDLVVSGVTDISENAAPVSWVTDRVLQTLKEDHPAPYHLIGKGIRIAAIMAKFLPTRWMDKILLKGFRGNSGKK